MPHEPPFRLSASRRAGLGALAALLCIAAPAAAQAPAAVTRVACVGEHSTDSSRVDNTLEYPARLQALLGASYEVAEFGFGTAALTATSFPTTKYADSSEYAASLAFEPDLVIVGPWGRGDAVGTVHIDDGANNNVHLYQDPTPLKTADFQSALSSLIAAYQALPGKPRVLLALPLPFPYGTGQGHIADIILPTTQQLADAEQLPTVDLFTPLLGHRDNFDDADHLAPTPGMQHIAELIFAAVQALDAPVNAGGSGGAAGAAAGGGGSSSGGAGGAVEKPIVSAGTDSGSGGAAGGSAPQAPSAGADAAGSVGSPNAAPPSTSSSSSCTLGSGSSRSSWQTLLAAALAALGVARRRSSRR